MRKELSYRVNCNNSDNILWIKIVRLGGPGDRLGGDTGLLYYCLFILFPRKKYFLFISIFSNTIPKGFYKFPNSINQRMKN